ncbi:MAG: zinc-ribbon domain-containing protein [Candidatus Omnitrophota bacterium]
MFNNSDCFDFEKETELPDKGSSPRKPCPNCAKPIPGDALFCLYCGEPVSPAGKNKWVILVVVFSLIAFLCLIFLSR